MIARKIISMLNKMGFVLQKKQALDKKNEIYTGFYMSLLNQVNPKINQNTASIDSIVFSKDRAMQLHAFLSSYTDNVKNLGKVIILYKASNTAHQQSYHDLKKQFCTKTFLFVEEHHFKNQLIDICEKSTANKIIFYVDDMIFTHAVDYNKIAQIDTNQYILSLSRGKDLDYSVVLQKKLDLPHFTPIDGFESFKWTDINYFSDWSYPLGVSGYMYSRIEIVAMLQSIDFKAPNSLEANMQVFLPFFINRLGLCGQRAICVCVHANIVQTENTNPILGTHSIEELLEQWQKNKEIDRNAFYNKPIGLTQIQSYRFIARENEKLQDNMLEAST